MNPKKRGFEPFWEEGGGTGKLGNIHLSLRSFSPISPVLHVHSKGLWGPSGPKVPGGCIIQRKAHPRTNTSDAFFPN